MRVVRAPSGTPVFRPPVGRPGSGQTSRDWGLSGFLLSPCQWRPAPGSPPAWPGPEDLCLLTTVSPVRPLALPPPTCLSSPQARSLLLRKGCFDRLGGAKPPSLWLLLTAPSQGVFLENLCNHISSSGFKPRPQIETWPPLSDSSSWRGLACSSWHPPRWGMLRRKG